MENWDWKQEEINKKKKEFRQWIKTWYKEHVTQPRRIISEIEYKLLTADMHSPTLRIEQQKETHILKPNNPNEYYNFKDIDELKLEHGEESKLTNKIISRVKVRIVPYSEENTNGLLLVDDQFQGAEDWPNPTTVKLNCYLKNIKTELWEMSDEMAICHLVSIYILHYDWVNNRNTSKGWFLETFESKLTIEELLSPFTPDGFPQKHDVGFESLIESLYSNGRRIRSLDLIPPTWFKYLLPQSELSLFKYSPNFRTIYIGEKKYNLTDRQAEIVKKLYEARQEGIEELSIAEIFSDLPTELKPPRLRDIFRSLPKWKELIVTGSKNGLYKLNF
ncbi:MAG: hypothetical protein ACTSW1_05695 [Candidatus Hodarchaeales archaeon]